MVRDQAPQRQRAPKGHHIQAKEIEQLKGIIKAQAPASGSNPNAYGSEADVAAIGFSAAVRFDELPISEFTKQGLRNGKFQTMTEIQRAALSHALSGRDVLGAAKTGSGKTLAFIIPILEALYLNQWGKHDGLGGLVISPVRELAMQIFEVLRIVGARHSFSAGLIIGGKNVEEEQERILTMNILIATPGRLLQHMDETPGFDCSSLKVLVLDEADRILDMGFSETMSAIIANLPTKEQGRQTLLFSATLDKSVRALATLSLKDPEFLSVHQQAKFSTPARLSQHYMVCDLPSKLNHVFSFIKTHLHSKTIIFFSSCNQVRFAFEVFKKMRPGVILQALHGKIKQERRALVFQEFCEQKAAVLLATDIAARGLDFPAVDWVVQVDCPEDIPTYIHRVGRTARYQCTGHALSLFLPSETHFIEMLKKKVPLHQTSANPEKVQHLKAKFQGFLSQEPELKLLAQKCFVSYVRSVHLQSDKEVFDVTKLPLEEYALSLGLPGPPRIRFLKGAKKNKNTPYALRDEKNEEEEEEDGEDIAVDTQKKNKKGKGLTLAERMMKFRATDDDEEESSEDDDDDKKKKKKKEEKSKKKNKKSKDDDDDDDDDDFLKPKVSRGDDVVHGEGSINNIAGLLAPRVSKRSLKKIKLHGSNNAHKVVFDEDGNPIAPFEKLAKEALEEGVLKGNMSAEERMKHAREQLKVQDKEDRKIQKQRQKEEKLAKKMKRKQQEQMMRGGDDVGVSLGGGGYDDDDDDGEGGYDYDDDDDHDMEDDVNGAYSEEEEEEEKPKKKDKNKKKKHHRDDEDNDNDNEKKKHETAAKKARSMDEEEDLALKILRAKRSQK